MIHCNKRVRALCAWLLGLSVMLPLGASEDLKRPAQTTKTERFDLPPGGVIRIENSFGDLSVEGWDQPQVELSVTRAMPYEYAPNHPTRAQQHMDAVHVAAELRSPSELTVSTTLPPRRGFIWHPIPPANVRGVAMQYELHVPRNSRLVIHHGVGQVSVNDVTGDIEATCRRGDIVLWLADTAPHAIHARARLGKVSSDFDGSSASQWLVGQKFTGPNSASSQQLHLSVGFGGITIKPGRM